MNEMTDGQAEDVVMTPAVARPEFGSVLVLAVGADAPDSSVEALEKALAAATAEEGVTVVTVRGVEALRTWRPQAAPELAIRLLREELDLARAETAAIRAAAANTARDLAEARELLDDIGVMAANAPEDGDSFGLLEEIAMRIAAHDVEEGK